MTNLRYVGASCSKAEGTALLKSGDYDVLMGAWGLMYTPLCIRSTVAHEDAAAVFTRHNPPGTEANKWVPVAKSDLPEIWGDQPYPAPCLDHPDTHVHILTAC